jgi:hypothetical protein
MSDKEENLQPDDTAAALTPEPQHAAPPDDEDDESDVDGCDVPITEAEATPDEELPPTEGGVA